MTSKDVALREATTSAVAQLRDKEFEQAMMLALPPEMSARRFLRVVANAVLDNPTLAAAELRPSLLKESLKAGADGLLPDGNEAAFVVYKVKGKPTVKYLPMIGGYRKIAAQHGISIFTFIVHENDIFEPDFDTGKTNYKPARLGSDPGEILGACAAAQHRDGRRWLEVMDVAEIEKVRATSRAKDSGPWVDWWTRMAEKTVARRLFKKLPLDPADAERAHRVLAADDLNGDDAANLLYGDRRAGGSSLPAPSDAHEGAEAGPQPRLAPSLQREPEPEPTDEADAVWEPIPDEADQPWEGEEPPPGGEPAPESEHETVTFSSGRYEGLSFEDVLAHGDDGLLYMRWAFRQWKTEPLRSALDRFAEQHPEIKGQA